MEEWRSVPGWDGQYSVTQHGNVRSEKTGRILKQTMGVDGYSRVSLKHNGKRSTPTIHRLIMESFVGPRPEGYHIRHLDGDKLNNTLDNLEYGTPKENAEDVKRHGRNHHMNKKACPYGHAYDGWNLVQRSRTKRACRACSRAASEVCRLRKRGRQADRRKLADQYYARLQLGDGQPNKHY